jgi:O-antigen ligase
MGRKKQPAKKTTTKTQEIVPPQDNWVIWLTYAILVLLPLAVSRISYDQFDMVKLAIFKVLVLAIAVVWVSRMVAKPRPIVWSWREALLIGFLVLGVLSVITSIHIPTSLHGKYKRYEGLLTFITYITSYLIALQVFRKKGHIRTLFEVISFTGAIVAFYGILQFAGLDPINWGDIPFELRRSFSTFGNPDLLAGYLVIAFPCALVSFFDDTKRRWWHGAAALILAIGLITALTRSGWIGAIVATLTLMLLLGRKLKNHWQELTAIGAFIVIALIGLVAYSAAVPSLSIASKFQGAFKLTSGTALSRFEIWKAGLHMVQDKPLFGQGLDTFRLASEHFETKTYVKTVHGGTVSDNAHNYFIQLAAGGGPAAAIILFTFFFAWIIRMVKIKPRAPDDSSELYIIGGAAAALGYLATLMFGISIVGASSTFWLLMGALSGYTCQLVPEYKTYDVSRWGQAPQMAASLSVILVSLVIAGYAVTMYAGDIYFVKGLKNQRQDLSVTEHYMNRASSLYPGNGRIQSQLGQIYVMWAGQAAANKDGELYRIYTDKALDSFNRARQAEPIEIDYQVFLANLYGNKGEPDKALDILREVLNRRPYSVPGLFLAGQYYANRGSNQEAIDYLELAYELSPENMDVSASLAQLYEKVGNHAQAVKYEKISSETSGN